MHKRLILELLKDFYSDAEAALWYESPNKLLCGESAKDLVSRGEEKVVLDAIQRLADCVYL